MKLVFIKCPHCGKRFYAEVLLSENRLPAHCPGCDAYLDYPMYAGQLTAGASSALARIRKPLNEKTIPEILYIPKKKETAGGGQR